jgi:endonuclease-3
MASSNRASLITQVIKVVKKNFKPASVVKERTLLEHLLFACCAENSPYEAADRVVNSLATDYFDWNEVRVSTIRELSQNMKPLNDPADAATRLKRILQSVFETHYSFDLEPLKKQNIGQASKTIENYNGSTRFVVSFVTQHALGGHAIPVNDGLLESMRILGVVSDAEAAKGTVPGLERSVPKSKGPEIASLLHQLGIEMHRSPLGPAIRKLLLAIDPDCKERLPKRQTARKTDPEPPVVVPPAGTASDGTTKKAKTTSRTAVEKKPASTGAAGKTPPSKSSAAKAKSTSAAPRKTPSKSGGKKTGGGKSAPVKKPAPGAAKKKTSPPKAAKKKVTKGKKTVSKASPAKKKSKGKAITRRKPR